MRHESAALKGKYSKVNIFTGNGDEKYPQIKQYLFEYSIKA